MSHENHLLFYSAKENDFMFNSSYSEFIEHHIIRPPCATNNAVLNRHKRPRSRNTKTFFTQAFIEVLECRLCFFSSEIKTISYDDPTVVKDINRDST